MQWRLSVKFLKSEDIWFVKKKSRWRDKLVIKYRFTFANMSFSVGPPRRDIGAHVIYFLCSLSITPCSCKKFACLFFINLLLFYDCIFLMVFLWNIFLSLMQWYQIFNDKKYHKDTDSFKYSLVSHFFISTIYLSLHVCTTTHFIGIWNVIKDLIRNKIG